MADTPSPVARTPLQAWHATHGARFREHAGWQVVAAYSEAPREVEGAQAGVAVADITALPQTAPGAERLVVHSPADATHASFWLIGPHGEALLRRLTQLDTRPSSFPVNTLVATALAGVEASLVRSAELTLPSVRVSVAWDVAEYVWERILGAGQDLGIIPMGWDALALLGAVIS